MSKEGIERNEIIEIKGIKHKRKDNMQTLKFWVWLTDGVILSIKTQSFYIKEG